MYLIHMFLIYLIYGHSYFAFVIVSFYKWIQTLWRLKKDVMNIVFFNNSWVNLYFFVENKGKPLYLICQKIKFFLKISFFQ
jgi:hypothetical protein